MVEDRNCSDKNQAVAASIKALRNILAAHRNVRVMLHPQRGDVENNPLADVFANFESGLSDIHIEHITRFPPHPDAASSTLGSFRTITIRAIRVCDSMRSM
jgi:hypothetical protein